MVIRIEVQVELERPQGADARTTESLTGDRHMHQQHSSTAAQQPQQQQQTSRWCDRVNS